MSDVQNILLILLILFGCALIGYLIFVLKRIVETIIVLQKEIRDLKTEVVPAIQQIALLSEQARATLQNFESHRDDLGLILSNTRAFSDNVLRLQSIVVDQIEPPLERAATLIGGIVKGFEAFTNSWKRSR